MLMGITFLLYGVLYNEGGSLGLLVFELPPTKKGPDMVRALSLAGTTIFTTTI